MAIKNKILVTDYILREIEKLNVKHVFGMTGGAVSNLIDAFSRSKIKYITVQHEQAAAMAADAYSRINGYGVVMVTSGPGGTNTITGVACSWFDSVPVLIITGQVSTFDLRTNDVRQRGFQEVDMVKAMSPFVKYSRLVDKAEELPNILEEAVKISLEGRPGPVHLDIPMNIQQAEIVGRSLNFFNVKKEVNINVDKVKVMISKSKRPVLIVGNGCRHCLKELSVLANKLNWPILPSWGMIDFVHPNRIEQFGVYGNRGANYSVQNSDLILSIGCRLDTRMTGSNPKLFAREAIKIIVDIDKNELEKGVLTPDLAICADSKDFINSLIQSKLTKMDNSWLEQCKKWVKKYPIETPKCNKISPYSFVKTLSEECNADVIVNDCGGNVAWMYQMYKPRVVISDTGSGMSIMHQFFKVKNQRFFTAMGNSPMGYSLPAAMGVGLLGKDVVATIGDGGVQINIQEFQTIKNYNIPLKLFIFSNKGYGLIRQFQDLYLGKRHIGTEEKTPDFEKIAKAYGLKAMTIKNPKEMRNKIKKALKMKQVIVNVIMDPNSVVVPRAIFGRPIEEQAPFLPDKEVEKNLLISRWKKS